MAEIVQQRLEDRIPGLEQLERVGLFTKKEVRLVIKKSTALEYKLHRPMLRKEDFITYIEYEIGVLELIKKRRLRIGYNFKKDEIEFPIMSRISSVFRRATAKWKDDLQLWLSHVAFCKKWNMKTQVSKVFLSLLAIHPDKPALWIMAAKCEMEDRNSSESARHLFLRALRFHPKNKKVYLEYFRMELMHAEKLRRQQKELEQAEMAMVSASFSMEILNGKLAEVVYKEATEKIKDAEFVLSFLNIAALFDFTKELQEMILQDLQNKYANDPLTWDYMAKCELEAGLGAEMGAELQSTKEKASDTVRREERSCLVYEEGLKSLQTEAMWTCYATFCWNRFKRKTNVTELKEKVKVLQSTGDADGATRVAVAATKRFSQSVETWSCSLQTLMELGSANVDELFQEALKHVNPKVTLLTSIGSGLHIFSCDQRGLASTVPAVSMEVKKKYLDWSYTTGGYKKARQTFRRCSSFTCEHPFKNITLESTDSLKMSNIRDYYERALREFGSSDEDLWLDYIKEERGPHGQAENSGSIHWRAMKSLEGECVERFVTKYTLLQTGHI
uniref:UTP6 small subunit processome component n=1 Tax=Scleropages formosus TaxID=113540 RepID=A0A8C9U558_SCLFO